MHHFHYINHCLQLAARGRGKVGNGALVGSCLVQGDEILAEAWHKEFGGLHAERLLLESKETSNSKPQTSNVILYVNLEPCCHQGKTPPCTDIIIESGIQTVVFGMYDPDPRVAGQGIQILQSAGIECIGPIDPAVCARFNRGFVSVRENGRPWITLKSAKTQDGRIANEDGSPLKITSEKQDAWSHKNLRAKHDAILVGVETIVKDDPSLTLRHCHPEHSRRMTSFQPHRIILDPHGRISSNAKVLNDEHSSNTVLITSEDADLSFADNAPFTIHHSPFNAHCFEWTDLWNTLLNIGITSVLVEGGAKTWQVFKDAGVVDEEVSLTSL